MTDRDHPRTIPDHPRTVLDHPRIILYSNHYIKFVTQ
jgi:hypothetical protein